MVAEGAFATGSLGSYCAAADVLGLLSAYDVASWGGEDALKARTLQLLGPTRRAVDSEAGRDFFHHEHDEIEIDGSGTEVLSLNGSGVSPPVEVSSVALNGVVLDAQGWRYYGSANSIKLTPNAGVRRFAEGTQNVSVVVSWGYESPPDDIALAQAKLAAAQLISELSAEGQAVQALSLGDYTVRYSAEGRYGGEIVRLVSAAKETIGKHRAMKMVSV